MSDYQRVANWLKACGKEPNAQNLSLQIGCCIEEIAEFVKSAKFTGVIASQLLPLLDMIASDLKSGNERAFFYTNKKEQTLDALCDIIVTIYGIAHFEGFDIDGAMQAVLAANDAKLVDGKPVILAGGKIGKPEGWKAPDLSQFVNDGGEA